MNQKQTDTIIRILIFLCVVVSSFCLAVVGSLIAIKRGW